jgi:glutamine synthetase adenylyltransferase
MKFVTSLLMSTALSVSAWGLVSLAPQSAAIAQLPEGVSLDDTAAAQQQAIEMLRTNPQMVLQLVETTLQQNPQLLQYLMQNPQLVEQVAGQNSELMQELQQHPELVEQLEDLLQ